MSEEEQQDEGGGEVVEEENPDDGEGGGGEPSEEEESIQISDMPKAQEEEVIEIEGDMPSDMDMSDIEADSGAEEQTATGGYTDIMDDWANPEPVKKEKKKKGQQQNMGLLSAFKDKADGDKENLKDQKDDLNQTKEPQERTVREDEVPDKSMRKRKEKDSRFYDRYQIFPTKKWRGGTKNEYVLRYRNGKCSPSEGVLEQYYPQFEEKLQKGGIKRVIYVPPKDHNTQNVEWDNCLFIQFHDDTIFYKGQFIIEFYMKKHGTPGKWDFFLEQKRGEHAIATQQGKIKYANFRNPRRVFTSTLKVRAETSKKKKKTGSGTKQKSKKQVFKDIVTAVGFNRHKIGSSTLDYIILGTDAMDLYYVQIVLTKRGESARGSYNCSKLRTLREDPAAPSNNKITSILIEEEAYKDYVFVMVSTHFELYMFRGKRISETEPFRFISFSSLMPIIHKHKGYTASPLRVYYKEDDMIAATGNAELDKRKKQSYRRKGLSKKAKKRRRAEELEALDVVKETYYVPKSFVQLTTQGILHGKFAFSKVDEDETSEMKKRALLFSTGGNGDNQLQDPNEAEGGPSNPNNSVEEDEDEAKFVGTSEDPIPHLHKGNLFLRDFEHLVFSDDNDVDWLRDYQEKPIDVACTRFHILFFRKEKGRITDLTILHYPPDLCQSLYGTTYIRNDMITFKRSFLEPYDDDYEAFDSSPYDESNVIMYGKHSIKTLLPFQEMRNMYPVYFQRARRWKEIKRMYEERKISYEEAQIQYELCRKYFLQLVVSIYSNQDKREGLVILELGHFCLSCGWYEDAAMYFTLSDISVDEVMELFLEINQPKHLRTYLMYKYKYKVMKLEHPVAKKFYEVGYFQFRKIQKEMEPNTKSISLIEVHTTIVELYLQELNELIRKLEVSVKTESIQKKITKIKMELLQWLTKNLKVKSKCNVNLIYQLMTSYGHFDIAFQFVLKQRTFEEVLTLWLEGKRGTDPNFDIFKHVVNRMQGDKKNLSILLKFARHLFKKAPSRTSESLGDKPKLAPSLVNFLPSLTNYGDFISHDFDLSSPKYLFKRAQQSFLDVEELDSFVKKRSLFDLNDNDVNEILNNYHSFNSEQTNFLRGERKKLMLRLISTIQLYETAQQHAKGMRKSMEVLNNQILFLLYQKLGNPAQLLKLNEEIKESELNLEFNVRNIDRNKLVTPFFKLSPQRHIELGLDKFHAGDFMSLTRRIRAYDIMGECCHILGLNMMGIRHMIQAAFLTRRLHVAIELKEEAEREANKRGAGRGGRRGGRKFNLEAKKGFVFLKKASQFANNPTIISKEGERMESGSDGAEGDSDEVKTFKRNLWNFLLKCVMTYEEEMEDLIDEERDNWSRHQADKLKRRFSKYHHEASKNMRSTDKARERFERSVKKDDDYSGSDHDDDDVDDFASSGNNDTWRRYFRSTGKASDSLNSQIESRLYDGSESKRGRRLGELYDKQRGSKNDLEHVSKILKETYEKGGVEEHKDFFFDVKEVQDSDLNQLVKKKQKKRKDRKSPKKKGKEGQDDGKKKGEEEGEEDTDDSEEMSSSSESSEEMESEGEDDHVGDPLAHGFMPDPSQVSLLDRDFFSGNSNFQRKRQEQQQNQLKQQQQQQQQKDSKKKRRKGKKKREEEDEDEGGSVAIRNLLFRNEYKEKYRIRTISNVQEVRVEFIARLMIIQKGHYVSLYDFLSYLPEDTTIGKFYREIEHALDRENDESVEKWKEIKQYTQREDDFAKPNEFLMFRGNQKCDSPDCVTEYILKGKDELFSFNCGHLFHGKCLEKKLVGARDLVNIAFMMQTADQNPDDEAPPEYFSEPLMTDLSLETVDKFGSSSSDSEEDDDEEEDGMAVLDDADDGVDENNIVDTPFRLSQLQLKQVIERLKHLDETMEKEKGTYKSDDMKMNRVFKRILKRIEEKSKKDVIMLGICPLCSINQISDIHMQLYALDEIDEWKIPNIRPKAPPSDSSSDEGTGRRGKKKKKKKVEKKNDEEEEEEEVEGDEEDDEEKDSDEEEEEEDVIVEEEEDDEEDDGKKE